MPMNFFLLCAGWNELLIASFAHRSVPLNETIALTPFIHMNRGPAAEQLSVGVIFDRILTDLVSKMRAMSVDRVELGCLRVIVLFNPGMINIESHQELSDLFYISCAVTS